MSDHEHNEGGAEPQEGARCCGGRLKSEPCAERGQHHHHHGEGGCGGHGHHGHNHEHGHGHGGCCGRHGAQQE